MRSSAPRHRAPRHRRTRRVNGLPYRRTSRSELLFAALVGLTLLAAAFTLGGLAAHPF